MADKLIDNHLGIVNCGNWYRIKKVMRKAKSGEPITVGFLGGSITQGSLSSEYTNCYLSAVSYQYLVKHRYLSFLSTIAKENSPFTQSLSPTYPLPSAK